MASSAERQTQRALARLARKNPVLALVVALVLVVCGLFGWAGANASGKTGGSSSEAQGALSAASDAQGDAASCEALQQARVMRVVDGDTLKVRLPDGSEKKVRLVGNDTPESVAADESRNCEEEVIAANYTKSLLETGRTVWLQQDVSDEDRYGRLLRYVWLERPGDPANESEIASKMLNAVLVREGYAQVKRYKPDTTLHDLFQRWGDEAAEAGKGVSRKWA